mmetsp:Transcript_19997/g.35972  ORF Transcript_19997/g.35972 Transcript_19997/m.35972 type:complete len:180 (-) Transcript_19997:252-791(-)|eukprot:CAMPEP_0175058504 /NCGR_PEP_ID=MMETSP0052_2-20121109/11883_1 /TAXON_ID=51329 ORGANISM="Polytomella parva, Strain SAG 63-3" /NCGR_SAMPLE_ID=MMETSP0052_2 /ASSEMBLY_ACC=CAM_ASM_000194 /LENGTH=179 /DNA_ID=CAMNT_0016323889 /DNA_START=71 /DNA_END=610 /DNA_ORIENTATION=-
MSTEPVRSLFVTLRRSPIGKPWFHRMVLYDFGLDTKNKTVEVANTALVRKALAKIPHLVTIETDKMHYLKSLKTFYEKLLRPPVQIAHNIELTPVVGPSVHRLDSKFVQQRLQQHSYPSKMEGFLTNYKRRELADAVQSIQNQAVREQQKQIIADKGLYSEEAMKVHMERLRIAAVSKH